MEGIARTRSASPIDLRNSQSDDETGDLEVNASSPVAYAVQTMLEAAPQLMAVTALSDAEQSARGSRLGEELFSGGTQAQLDKLCDMIAKDLPQSVNRQEFKAGLKQLFRLSLHEFTKNSSTPLDKVFFAKLDEQMEQAVKNSPVASTWWQQAKRNGVAAFVVGTFGFGAVALIMKAVVHFSGMGTQGVHFAMFAGPWIAFVVESTIGAIKAGGAGYVALDGAAYQSYDSLVARIARKEKQLEGLRRNDDPSADAIDKAEDELAALHTKIQPIVVDLLRREFGHSLGLKKENEQTDVPVSCICQCINSKLLAVDHEVRLPNGAGPLFTVVRAGDTEVVVCWPNGKQTNLMKDPIPKAYREDFKDATAMLMGAARCRSFIADDLTFNIFGVPFLWNMAGPHMLAARLGYANVGDTLLMFASSFFGSFMLVFLQNAVRSGLTGAPTGWGSHTPVTDARHNTAKVDVQMARARLETFRNVQKNLRGAIDLATQEHSDLKGKLGSGRASRKKVDSAQKKLEALHNLEADIKKACKALVKAKAAAKTEVRRTAGMMPMTAVGLQSSWKALGDNPPRAVAKFLGYTMTYALYSELWTLTGQAALRPHSTQMTNTTMSGNFTEVMAGNATTAELPAGLSEWLPFMAMNGLGGLSMSVVFMARNNPVTRGIEFVLHQAVGYAEQAIARYTLQTSDDVIKMPDMKRDPTRLVSAFRSDGVLERDEADQILDVLVAISPDVLISTEGLREDLAALAVEKRWSPRQIKQLEQTITLLLDKRDDAKGNFIDQADDMKAALTNVRWWCVDQSEQGEGRIPQDSLVGDRSTPDASYEATDVSKAMGRRPNALLDDWNENASAIEMQIEPGPTRLIGIVIDKVATGISVEAALGELLTEGDLGQDEIDQLRTSTQVLQHHWDGWSTVFGPTMRDAINRMGDWAQRH